MILFDTQTLYWWRMDQARLGPAALNLISAAWQSGDAAVSAISFWEIRMLQEKGRLSLPTDADNWRQELIADGLIEIPLTGDIGIRAAALANFHGDPADRMIVATALAGHRLVTSDRQILAWDGPLDRVNARR